MIRLMAGAVVLGVDRGHQEKVFRKEKQRDKTQKQKEANIKTKQHVWYDSWYVICMHENERHGFFIA